jgi:hypothetical protein
MFSDDVVCVVSHAPTKHKRKNNENKKIKIAFINAAKL